MNDAIHFGARYDLVLKWGEAIDWTITFVDPTTRLPIDITGWSVDFEIFTDPKDVSALLTASTGNAKLTLDGSNGKVTFAVTDEDMELSTSQRDLRYALRYTNLAGNEKIGAWGDCIVERIRRSAA